MSLGCLKASKNGVTLTVQAQPRAKITEIVDLSGDRCKIKVKASPIEGEANTAIIEYLARLFGLMKKQVVLAHGFKGKQKVFLLEGISLETAENILSGAISHSRGKESA
jgi:uncharacterized protein (TIGR00251 family)